MRNQSNTKLPWEELDTWANQKSPSNLARRIRNDCFTQQFIGQSIGKNWFVPFISCSFPPVQLFPSGVAAGTLGTWFLGFLSSWTRRTSWQVKTSRLHSLDVSYVSPKLNQQHFDYMTWIYLDEQSNDSAIFGTFAQVRNEPWRFLHSSAHFTTTAAESSGSSWVREDTLGTHVEIPNQHGDMEHLSNLYFTSKWNAPECSEVVVAPSFSWHVMQSYNPIWSVGIKPSLEPLARFSTEISDDCCNHVLP